MSPLIGSRPGHVFPFDSIFLPFWPDAPFSSEWDAQQCGLWAERVVARQLWFEGWRLLEHRWQSGTRSDIDLIACNDDLILFVEVKFRLDEADEGWREIYDAKRQKRLRSAVVEYLRGRRLHPVDHRVDGFVVTASGAGKPVIRRETGYLETGLRGSPNRIATRPLALHPEGA